MTKIIVVSVSDEADRVEKNTESQAARSTSKERDYDNNVLFLLNRFLSPRHEIILFTAFLWVRVL